VLTRRGVCYAELGRDSLALLDLGVAIKAQASFEPLFIRASRLLKQRKFAESIADFDAALRFNDKSAESYYMRGYAKLASGVAQGGCIDLAQARLLNFPSAQKLLDEYCEVMPNLDSLRRYKFAEVVVTAERSPEAIAIKESRRILTRTMNLIANPMPQSATSLNTGLASAVQQLPPGMINPVDCNKMRLEFSRPSEISPYCVVQVLMEELQAINDPTAKSMLREAFNTANELYTLESGSASGLDGTIITTRLRLAEELRGLNTFLEQYNTEKLKSNKSGAKNPSSNSQDGQQR
jgi:tetratricopeptide (TPR) repeat protein